MKTKRKTLRKKRKDLRWIKLKREMMKPSDVYRSSPAMFGNSNSWKMTFDL